MDISFRSGRRTVRIIVFAVIVLFAACGLFKKEGEVTLSQVEAGIRIDNGTFVDIHYVLAEADFMQSITWWGGDDSWPRVDAEDAEIRTFADIPNGQSEAVGPGDRLIMYWWDRNYHDDEDLHKLALDIK